MKKNIDYIFIFPKSVHGFSLGNTFGGFDYHLGAGYIRAFLKKKKISSSVYLSHGNLSLNQCAIEILSPNPQIIAFSVYDSNYYLCKVLANEIRKLNSTITIIFGGPSPTFSDRAIMNDCSAVDLCVRWYGEVACYELAQWKRGRKNLDSIPGITYRVNGAIRRNIDRTISEAIPHIESSGHSCCLDVFPDPYIENCIPLIRAYDLGVITSRGCVYPCTFCNCSAISRGNIFYHSEKRILQLFNHLDSKIESKTLIAINDDNFSLRPRFHSLLKAIGNRKYKNIEFWAEMRTEPLRESSFSLLKKANFRKVHFGLESGVPKILSIIKKVRSRGGEKDNYEEERKYLAKIKWAVEESKRNGLSPGVSIILGCPGETEEEGKKTLDFVKSLKVDRYAHNFLVIQDGTELSKNCGNFGLRVSRFPDRALPLKTELTYNVAKLPILEEEGISLSHNSDDHLQALRLLTGSLITQEPAMGEGYEQRISGATTCPVINLPVSILNDNLLTWLGKEITLNTGLWIRHDERTEPQTINNLLSKIGVPIQQVNTLSYRRDPKGITKIRINELSTKTPDYNTCMIVSIDGEKPVSDGVAAVGASKRRSLMIKINNDKDLAAIAKAGSNCIQCDGSMLIKSDLSKTIISIEDECRWSSSKCPAITGLRWTFDDSGKIYTCKNGSQIGTVGDSFDELKMKVQNLWSKERHRRGCDSCANIHTCSMCLFTYPLSSEEFCQFKKSDMSVWKFVDGIRMLRVLKRTEDSELQFDSIQFIYAKANLAGQLNSKNRVISLGSCQIINIDDKKRYLHHLTDDLIMPLNDEAFEIFKVIFEA